MKTLLKIELERAFKNKWFYIILFIELVLVIVDVSTVALPARRAYEDIYIYNLEIIRFQEHIVYGWLLIVALYISCFI